MAAYWYRQFNCLIERIRAEARVEGCRAHRARVLEFLDRTEGTAAD